MKQDWNVIATSRGGHEDSLIAAIHDLGGFERTGSPGVIVGQVENRGDFLERLQARMESNSHLPSLLGRAVPVECTVELDGLDPVRPLEDAVLCLAGRIGNATYHVRVDAHGHGPIAHPHDLEQRLGDALWRELKQRGFEARVTFDDPELVVLIELVGDAAGLALVDRETRRQYYFMKVRG